MTAAQIFVAGAAAGWIVRAVVARVDDVRRARQLATTIGGSVRAIPGCCVSAPPADWLQRPVGYSWVCGVCDQWWEKTGPARAERAAPPTADTARSRP